MKDAFNREINYLRVSLTERCQLACLYCRSTKDEMGKQEMTYDELMRVVASMAKCGIRKVRLTGGEPLIRKDIIPIIQGIYRIEGIEDVSITTNGVFLSRYAKELKASGIKCINISLDSLKEEKYLRMTGCNLLRTVKQGMEQVLALGIRVKLNVVLMRNYNDDEIDDFIALADELDIEVRFIELMPMNHEVEEVSLYRITGKEILEKHPQLKPLEEEYYGQPAKVYKMDGCKGKVGLISPLSSCFCNSCNRIRLLSTAKLRPCLGSEREISLEEALKMPSDESLEQVIRNAIWSKPKKYEFLSEGKSKCHMNQIGG